MVYTAVLISTLLPIKFILFFGIFIQLKLRARTAYLAGLALSNFSEFGLIVVALAVSLGWLGKEWLIILALAVSLSFVVTSILYSSAHTTYQQLKDRLKVFEKPLRLIEDKYVEPEGARVLVVGMGRVGKGAYNALRTILEDSVWGMDADPQRIHQQTDAGMQVILGDGEDAELWENIHVESIELILLALPSIEDMSNISAQLRQANYNGKIAAIARYEDEVQALLDTGTDKVFNFFTEAGIGFAEESLGMLKEQSN